MKYAIVKVSSPPDPDFHRPRNGPGWRIFDENPPLILGEDVEGYGWNPFNPPRRAPALSGWFARKRDAVAHCAKLNRAAIAKATQDPTV